MSWFFYLPVFVFIIIFVFLLLYNKSLQSRNSNIRFRFNIPRMRYVITVVLLFILALAIPYDKILDVSFSSLEEGSAHYVSKNDEVLALLEDNGVGLVLFRNGGVAGNHDMLLFNKSEDGRWRAANNNLFGRSFRSYLDAKYSNFSIQHVYDRSYGKGITWIKEESKALLPSQIWDKILPIEGVSDSLQSSFKKCITVNSKNPQAYFTLYYTSTGILPEDYTVYVNGIACLLVSF